MEEHPSPEKIEHHYQYEIQLKQRNFLKDIQQILTNSKNITRNDLIRILKMYCKGQFAHVREEINCYVVMELLEIFQDGLNKHKILLIDSGSIGLCVRTDSEKFD